MNMCTNDIKANPNPYQNPLQFDMTYKELRIITADNIKLYGWFMYHPDSGSFKRPTFIYFHENAGNIGFRLPFAQLLYQYLKVNVLVVGYRGYGYSEGTPTEEGLMIDAESILNYVLRPDLGNKDEREKLTGDDDIHKYINVDDVYIFGRSLGGAVSVYIADKQKLNVRGIILENTFSSMGGMVDHLFPLFKHFKNLLLTNKWPSNERIKNIKLPILFFSSEHDELVPFSHMEELYNAAASARFRQKFIISGGTHNESWQKSITEYVSQISEFMKKCGSENIGSEMVNISNEDVNLIGSCNSDKYDCSGNMEEELSLIGKKHD